MGRYTLILIGAWGAYAAVHSADISAPALLWTALALTVSGMVATRLLRRREARPTSSGADRAVPPLAAEHDAL